MKNYWQGKKIKLRAFEEKDIQKYISTRNNPDSIRQYYEDYIEFPMSESELRETIEKYTRTFIHDDRRLFVIENPEGAYAGELSIWHTHRRNGVFRYGIFLDDKMRGMGYGKEALIIALDYYFNELNYQKCSPMAYSFNINSQKFHESFGFIKEGQLRNDIYARGSYHDMIYYGMLKDEFNKLYKHDFL
ncbi:MAG: GNAT family N-acetyltransferase [Clostridiales bacterium]|nr:GNAT family N-acetyltransferase [Clostridiales bacterium]